MDWNRYECVIRSMKKEGIEQLLISDPVSIYYLTGKMIHCGERMLVLYLDIEKAPLLVIGKLFPQDEELCHDHQYGKRSGDRPEGTGMGAGNRGDPLCRTGYHGNRTYRSGRPTAEAGQCDSESPQRLLRHRLEKNPDRHGLSADSHRCHPGNCICPLRCQPGNPRPGGHGLCPDLVTRRTRQWHMDVKL